MDPMLPDLYPTPTIRSIANGDWAQPSTWNLPRVPSAEDVAWIEHAVTISGSWTVGAISVRAGGTLTIAGPCLHLYVSTLQILTGGMLAGGSVSSPCTGEIIFTAGPLGTDNWGCGLVCEGKLKLFGRHIPRRHLAIAKPPTTGATTITLKEPPYGWQVGDRVLLPSVNWNQWGNPDAAVNQFRTIAAIDEYGVTLDAPLVNSSPTYPLEPDGRNRFMGYLVNLTASIVLRSQDSAGVRGHSVFTGEADITCDGVMFQDMGRTHKGVLDAQNPIGKYAVHCHHLMGPIHENSRPDGKQFSVRGCVIERSTKWPVAIHNSSWGEFSDNVVWDGELDGIATESGVEIGTRIERNFIGCIRDGSGIWHRSSMCPTNDNVINGARINGDHFAGGVYYQGLLSITSGEAPLPPIPSPVPKFPGAHHESDMVSLKWNDVPVTECSGNECICCWTGIGLDHRKCQSYPYTKTDRHRIADTILWNSFGAAVNHYDTRGTLADGVVTRNILNNGPMGGAGSDMNCEYRRLDIYASTGNGLNFMMPQPLKLLVEDSTITALKPVEAAKPVNANPGDPPEADPGLRLTLRSCKLIPTGANPTVTIMPGGSDTLAFSIKTEDEDGVRGVNNTIHQQP